VAGLRKRAEEHCGKGVLEKTCLLELGWCTEEMIVTLLCHRYIFCRNITEEAPILLFFTFESTSESFYKPQE